jgi:hypothetical protein
MNSQYYPEDFEPVSYIKRNPWVAPAVMTGLVVGVMAVARAAVPAVAAFLPDALYLSLFFAGSFLTWRAAFWTDTRSSRVVRFVAPALPLAVLAAAAFVTQAPVIG